VSIIDDGVLGVLLKEDLDQGMGIVQYELLGVRHKDMLYSDEYKKLLKIWLENEI